MRISVGCAVASVLLLAAATGAAPKSDDDARVAAKRLRSPVDARMRALAGAPGQLRARPRDRATRGRCSCARAASSSTRRRMATRRPCSARLAAFDAAARIQSL
jgi:hypothetical protein